MLTVFSDESFMKQAFNQAKLAFDAGELPIGAVVVSNNKIIARAHNQTELLNDFTAHAEMLAFTSASEFFGNKYLNKCTLYVTLEPCPMCAAAISNARIANLYFGARDIKSGGINQGPCIFNHPQSHHKPEIYDGISELECRKLLLDFFKHKRN